MTANTSPAVMQQRAPRSGLPDAPPELDYFPTPPWATRAVCEWLDLHGYAVPDQLCWEPACGEGFMALALHEYFEVMASDVCDYGFEPAEIRDFLIASTDDPSCDFIFTNPPFVLAEQFIARALDIARTGVVMIVRQAFTEGEKRYHRLFQHTPPSFELQFTERVVMLSGRLIQSGAPDPFNLDATGQPRKASTASAAIALVWLRNPDGTWNHDTRKRWIAPCRRRLERAGDYPAYPEQWAAIERRDEGDLLCQS